MALGPKMFSLIVAILGVLSFILGIYAELKKPAAGEKIAGKGVVICKYHSYTTLVCGYLSTVFLVAATGVGYFSVFYPYKGRSIPQSVLFHNGTFMTSFNISVFTAGLAAALLLWTTITEHIHLIHNVHENLKEDCPISKKGVLGGAAFVSLDASLFWLVSLMVGCNTREDYFEETEMEDKSQVVSIG
ncbi:uncharacterized protein LOC132286823 [Cornus florida]|uniref:uncharacterized protein LOC132286823 n=1 Tax=Cornus florida TaxID=4283 RepID=UPI00289DAC55|nr:uncharacterized protein LOC132286823 [Cornus florida]